MATPQRIKALDQNVVNRIAAGEIIVAPVNALKELIENAVDAGSTSIEIAVKDGGLKLLQITDNGSGINCDDLAILCKRFTTSKLKAFEDLASIGTYGFRGEALASISMIAHLSVTTKTKDSNCAWKAVYADGVLAPPKPGQSADPKPVAGRQGTQITVEDLFYNTPSRRRAFRSTSEEYAKILDVVGRYAVHCEGVAFSCKKHGETDAGVSTTSNASLKDRIRRVHGSAVANEVVPFAVADSALGFKSKGMLSNANYHVKKTTLLLFINGRSVGSTAIRKAIDATYSTFLPKGGHPFVYLSIDIEPQRVDVNVHPTKREVNFLHEDEIIEKIVTAIQEQLAAVDTSRSYVLTQTLLPGAQSNPQPPPSRTSTNAPFKPPTAAGPSTGSKQQPKKPYENNTVRVDARDRKITSMLPPLTRDPSSGGGGSTLPRASVGIGNAAEYEYDDTRQWEEVRYATIHTLRQNVRDSAHGGLAELFQNHIYVGLVDATRRLAAVQHGVKLYLVDYAAVAYELFYQIGLSDFRNFGRIQLNPPLALAEVLSIAVEEEKKEEMSRSERRRGGAGPVQSGKGSSVVEGDDDGDVVMADHGEGFDWEGATKTVEALLRDKRLMLRDYFSIEIDDDGNLVSIPLLLKGYVPCLGKIPAFLLRLGPNVDWNSEQECFDTFLRELARFYVPEPAPRGSSSEPTPRTTDVDAGAAAGAGAAGGTAVAGLTTASVDAAPPDVRRRREELAALVEGILFPAFRKRLIPTNALLGSVTEIANLKGLYRIFERSC